MAKINPQDLKDRLLAPGFTAPPKVLEQLSDPVSDTPMVLTLDQVLPWHDNPRTTRNPKFDEIKESIRHRGLDTPPPVTRRPGEDKYRIRNGGNTRLEILNELYKETGDERYFRFNCLFRPWDKQRGEIIALTGHLAENDLKGDLKFIERAVGIQKAKAWYEEEKGEPVGIRELSRKLTDDGYPVSPSHISRMLDAVEILLPAIPVMLYSGLGKPQIEKLLSLRKSASSCWTRLYAGEGIDFEMLFQDTLAIFDSSPDEFIFDRFQDELIDQMKRPLGLRYDQILLEITNGQQEQRRGTLVDLPAPAAPPGIPAVGQENPAASTTGQAQSQLLQALSGQVQVVLNSHDQQTCRDALGEFQFSAGLAQLLLGQPTTGDQPSSQAGRLNDEALVKLFRIIRLARRLVDLELPPAASEQAATDQ